MLSNRNANIGPCFVRLISADTYKPLLLLSWVFYMIQIILIKIEGVFPPAVLLLSPVGLEQSVHQSRGAAGPGCLLGGLKFVLIETKKKKISDTWHVPSDSGQKASDQWQLRWKKDHGWISRKQLLV